MGGISIAIEDIPPKLRLYLMISPGLDLNYRCLLRSGGLLDQDYIDVIWFDFIEQRIREILARKEKQEIAKLKKGKF